jgi:hypothetical protein
MFDPRLMEWRKFTSSDFLGSPPSPRYQCGIATVSGSLYLFGGRGQTREQPAQLQKVSVTT